MRCVECDREMAPCRTPLDQRRGRPVHDGRGLCGTCRGRHRVRGSLIDFERPSRSIEEVVEEWTMLRDQGHNRRQAAPRMGMTHHALEQALRRAVKRGLLTTRQSQSFRYLEKRSA